ncbi:MAG: hypothetical protein UCO57_00875 [Gemmiger sp.]|uniref:hypothetical protein n=1 Tax=Gemmiger sp. TaxID=2049027 RepID=UPI002E7922F4|nr:hypothetical protein [Gemmiger sp.]MEE0707323.1 hypothetical protein [Gemmiger sp.]
MKKSTIIIIAIIACGVLLFFLYRNKVQEDARIAYESSYEHEVLSEIKKSSEEISQRSAEAQERLNDKIEAAEELEDLME